MAFLKTYLDSGLAVIALQAGEQGNKLNLSRLQELDQALKKNAADQDARVILLRSERGSFCLGMDLEFFQAVQEDSPQKQNAVAIYGKILSFIHNCPKPVAAIVNGSVKAGGVGLVAACDIVLASDKASFELSEVLLGLIPANVLPFLLNLRLPLQKVRYLALTAKNLSADEAAALNLVDEVFPESELEKGVKLRLKPLFRAAPHALAEVKQFTRRLLSQDPEQASGLAQDKLLELAQRPDVREAIRSFNEGDLPSWFAKFRPEKPVTE